MFQRKCSFSSSSDIGSLRHRLESNNLNMQLNGLNFSTNFPPMGDGQWVREHDRTLQKRGVAARGLSTVCPQGMRVTLEVASTLLTFKHVPWGNPDGNSEETLRCSWPSVGSQTRWLLRCTTNAQCLQTLLASRDFYNADAQGTTCSNSTKATRYTARQTYSKEGGPLQTEGRELKGSHKATSAGQTHMFCLVKQTSIKQNRGRPQGLVAKFGTLCFSGPGSVPGCGPIPLVSGHAVEVTHTQNRERLAQMLAQGESSSPKRKQKKKRKTESITSRHAVKVRSFTEFLLHFINMQMHVYVYMYICMCTCICNVYMQMHVCSHVLYVYVHMCMYVCIYICICICVCVYTLCELGPNVKCTYYFWKQAKLLKITDLKKQQ